MRLLIGVSELCIVLIVLYDVVVVVIVKMLVCVILKCVFLFFMLLFDCSVFVDWLMCSVVSVGLLVCLVFILMLIVIVNVIVIVVSIVMFCWWLLIMWLNIRYSVVGMIRIVKILMKFVNGVGFLYGCVEFVLKKLLLLVLSILIVFCDVIGFIVSVCFVSGVGIVIVLFLLFFIGLFCVLSFGVV